MTKTFIKGKRIYLRTLTSNDCKGSYAQWLNDAEVCRYNSHHVFPYTKVAAKRYVEAVNSSKSDLVLAIVGKRRNKHIGNISLQRINYISRSAEFAILIGEKDYWGKGYAREAASLIIEHGFSQMNLNRIYCGTNVKNTPMKRLAKGLGMVEEGRRRQAMYKDNRFVDVTEYGLLKKEFYKNRRRKSK